MDLSFFLLMSLMVFIMEHEASASAASMSASEHRPGKEQLISPGFRIHHIEKRCSCENLKDKECVYFCHIGIVWINTPSQVIPYGVGSLRIRRDVKRCHCKNKRDARCLKFCSHWDSPNPPRKMRKRFKEMSYNLKNLKKLRKL